MNTQYKSTIKAFGRVSGAYGDAIESLRGIVGHTDASTISDAVSLEKQWQAFLTSPEYKNAGGIIQEAMLEGLSKAATKRVMLTSDYLKAGTKAQDLMRKSMQRIRAKSGYTADRKGVISAKKTVVRGTKERADEVKVKPAAKELAVHSIASPTEAAKVVSAISTWKTALGAVIDAFKGDMPKDVLSVLRSAQFGIAKEIVAPKTKQKA